MSGLLLRRILVYSAALTWLAATPGLAQTRAKPRRTPVNRRYQSSGGPAKAARAQPVSAVTRAEAIEGIQSKIAAGEALEIENVAALVTFFERLYHLDHGHRDAPVRVLHYGDSHTAADEWTAAIRIRLQEKFGDGGAGFTLAGRPWKGYRHFAAKSGSTRGWHAVGLSRRKSDGVAGLAGVGMDTSKTHESAYLIAAGSVFELYYLRQPGGGTFAVYDNDTFVEQVSTDGELAPGYFRYETEEGAHRLEIETLDRAPVRLFGWTADHAAGLTYEMLGINGASAPFLLDWDEAVLSSNLARRDPSLIVLSYGTNEAGRKDWTLESYRDAFLRVIERLRAAAPAAAILVIGPPDREIRVRRKWQPLENIDMILEAQRQAASLAGCAFWDMRAKMGGKGSMRQWVLSGLGHTDHVHFTAPGYRLLGETLYRDLMNQYGRFTKAREALAGAQEDAVPAPAQAETRR